MNIKIKISIYLRSIPVKDGKNVLEGDEKYIIWTTTPWTLPANLGISVHPELEYSIVKVNDEKYIIASELFETVAKTLEWENAEVVKTVKVANLSIQLQNIHSTIVIH